MIWAGILRLVFKLMETPGSAPAIDEQTHEQPRKQSLRGSMSLLLGLLLSGAFLYLALRNTNPALTWQTLSSVNPAFLILAILIGSLSNLIRAARWRVFLGYSMRISLRHLFNSMMIGYMANNVLPARMGELVRIYALERSTGVSKSRSAATIVLERTTDALVLLTTVGVISLFSPMPDLIRRGSLIAAVGCAAAAVALLFLAFESEKVARPINRIISAISHNLGKRTQHVVARFAEGLGVLRSLKQGVLVLALTLGIWAVEAIAITLVMMSLNLSLPWAASVFLLVVLSLSFIIPAAPGGVGTYEFFVVAAMASFGLDSSRAAGLALVLHAIMYFTSGTLGLACLWSESLSFRELNRRAI
ncbi:MAG TPA: lysylphosphatidylglycerol synthase transmembrane domain-containing protein [Blastocatellia bacterium]|nr:lysylphosphatidylglycerol synthase transmembrane domain-containing protein [Blastocatellia bacterium]